MWILSEMRRPATLAKSDLKRREKKNGALSGKRTPPCPQPPHMKHPLG